MCAISLWAVWSALVGSLVYALSFSCFQFLFFRGTIDIVQMLCFSTCPQFTAKIWFVLEFIFSTRFLKFRYSQLPSLGQFLLSHKIYIVSEQERYNSSQSTHKSSNGERSCGDLAGHSSGPLLPIQHCVKLVSKYCRPSKAQCRRAPCCWKIRHLGKLDIFSTA